MHAGTHACTHTYTQPFYALLDFVQDSQVSMHQKGKTRKVKPICIYWSSEWQWHQLGNMQICTLSQTHNHANITQLFL